MPHNATPIIKVIIMKINFLLLIILLGLSMPSAALSGQCDGPSPRLVDPMRARSYSLRWQHDRFVAYMQDSQMQVPGMLEVYIANNYLLTTDIAVVGRFIANAPNGVQPLDYPNDSILMQFQIDEVIRGGLEPNQVIMMRVAKLDLHRPEYDIDLGELYRQNGLCAYFDKIATYFEEQIDNNAAVKLGNSYLIFARKHAIGDYYEVPFADKFIFSQQQYEALGLDKVRLVVNSQEWKDRLNGPTAQGWRANKLRHYRESDASQKVRDRFTIGEWE